MKLALVALALAAAPSGLAMGPFVPDTNTPTVAPTKDPTAAPTKDPTAAPTKDPTVAPTKAPTLPVGGPAAAACLAAGGDCDSCCGGCTLKTPEADGTAFQHLDECVCFEGELSGDSISMYVVTLTNSNDCAKVTGSRLKIKARARRPFRAHDPAPRWMVAFRAGPRWQRRDCCQRQTQPPLRVPRVRPPHRS